MYLLDTQALDLLVAPHQRLWVARPGSAYRAVTAAAFHASKNEWQFKKDCTWAGVEREWMEFEPFDRYTSRTQYLDRVRMDDWLEFLGYYLSEGRAYRNPASGAHLVQVAQFRTSDAWQAIRDNLDRLGLRARYNEEDQRFEIYSLWLHGVLAPLGDSYTKYVPAYVQDLAPPAPHLPRRLPGRRRPPGGVLGVRLVVASAGLRRLGRLPQARLVRADGRDEPERQLAEAAALALPDQPQAPPALVEEGPGEGLPVGAGGDGPLRRGRSTAWRCPTGWSIASGGASRTGCATAADRPGPPINCVATTAPGRCSPMQTRRAARRPRPCPGAACRSGRSPAAAR